MSEPLNIGVPPPLCSEPIPARVAVALHVIQLCRYAEAPGTALTPNGVLQVTPGRDLDVDEGRARLAANECVRAFCAGESESYPEARVTPALPAADRQDAKPAEEPQR